MTFSSKHSSDELLSSSSLQSEESLDEALSSEALEVPANRVHKAQEVPRESLRKSQNTVTNGFTERLESKIWIEAKPRKDKPWSAVTKEQMSKLNASAKKRGKQPYFTIREIMLMHKLEEKWRDVWAEELVRLGNMKLELLDRMKALQMEIKNIDNLYDNLNENCKTLGFNPRNLNFN